MLRAGARPPGTGGTLTGYDQENAPVCSETCHVLAADNDVAE